MQEITTGYVLTAEEYARLPDVACKGRCLGKCYAHFWLCIQPIEKDSTYNTLCEQILSYTPFLKSGTFEERLVVFFDLHLEDYERARVTPWGTFPLLSATNPVPNGTSKRDPPKDINVAMFDARFVSICCRLEADKEKFLAQISWFVQFARTTLL